MPKKMSKGERINITDLAMNWAIIEPRKRYKTATDYAYYLEKDFRRCYEQGKKDQAKEDQKLIDIDTHQQNILRKELESRMMSDRRSEQYAYERGKERGEKIGEPKAYVEVWEYLKEKSEDVEYEFYSFVKWLEQRIKELKEVKNG